MNPRSMGQEQEAVGQESLTMPSWLICSLSTFHPFRVSHLTVYAQFIFCDIPLVSNTDTWTYIVGSRVRHYWQNLLPLFHRHGPRMKELGFVILTCFFLSLAELTEENIKVLIVFERSMRRHKAFCSCAQRIIHEVNHWHFFKGLLQKSVPGWAHRPQLEAMGGIAVWSPFVRKVFTAKEFAEFRA